MTKPTISKITSAWLCWPSTHRLMAVLHDAGGQAWFVGGCVRDSLLSANGNDPEVDVDVATDLRPEQVLAAAGGAGMRSVPTGIAHGTVTVIVQGRAFEVTTLREDVQTDGRHALVAFGTDLTKDAARRDFTINALYALRDGLIVDPLNGLNDVRSRLIRFIGDPDRRILEDYLRILRFFRFFARFGRDAPDPEGLAACLRHRDRLATLSAERIAKELFKLLMADQAVAALAIMKSGGILASMCLDGADPDRLARLLALDQPVDALLRFAALFRDAEPMPGRGTHLAKRLHLSAVERDSLEALLGLPLPSLDEPRAERRLTWYQDGTTRPWRDRYLLSAALSNEASIDLVASIAQAEHWVAPAFPLRGAEVIAAGVAAGAEVGSLLRAVERWWLERDMQPDREACMGELQRRLVP